MRKTVSVLFTLIFFLTGFITISKASEGSNTQANNPLTIAQLYLNDGGRAIPFSRAMYDTTLFIADFGCRLDSGKVDLVIVLDTSGSMSTKMSSVKSALDGACASFHAHDYEMNYAIVTFNDTFFMHDYSPAAGYQLTNGYPTIHSEISSIGASGEPSCNEWAWTALWHALNDYQWRKDALRIVILVTDEASCALDVSGCATESCEVYAIDSLHPYPQYANPKMKAVSEAFVIYTMTPSTLSAGATSCSTAFWDTMYHRIASETGGTNFDISATWPTLYNTIRPMVDSAKVLTVCLTNNSNDTIDTARIEFEPGDSMTTIAGDSIKYLYCWPPGSTYCFSWRLHMTTTNPTEGNCFWLYTRAITDSSTDTTTIRGCMVPCGLYIPYTDTCSGPYVTNICPPDTTAGTTIFSACPEQEIVVSIADSDTTVDSTSIRFRVSSSRGTFTYTIDSSQLSWDPPYLTFTPDSAWTNNTTVTYKVTYVDDAKGCHVSSTSDGSFAVDLQPPVITNANPADGHIFTSGVFVASYSFIDSFSGVRTDSSLYVIIEDTLTLYASSSYIIVGPGSRITISGLWTYFCSDETMKVCVHLADSVPEFIIIGDDTCDLCGPNDTTYCYHYINTSLRVLPEKKLDESVLVYPNPFNDALTIELSGDQQSPPIVEVYDLNGKLVAKPSQIDVKDGKSFLKWKPENLPSGIYILMIETGNKVYYKKIKYMK